MASYPRHIIWEFHLPGDTETHLVDLIPAKFVFAFHVPPYKESTSLVVPFDINTGWFKPPRSHRPVPATLLPDGRFHIDEFRRIRLMPVEVGITEMKSAEQEHLGGFAFTTEQYPVGRKLVEFVPVLPFAPMPGKKKNKAVYE